MGENLHEDTNEISSECIRNILECIDLKNIKSKLTEYLNKELGDFGGNRVEIENIAIAVVRDGQDTMAMEADSYVKYSENDYALVDVNRDDNEDTIKEKVLNAIKSAGDNRNYICTAKKFFGNKLVGTEKNSIMFTHYVVWCLGTNKETYGYKDKVFGELILDFLKLCFEDSEEIGYWSKQNHITDYWKNCTINGKFDFRTSYVEIVKSEYNIESFTRIAITPYEKRECFGKLLLLPEDTDFDKIASFAVKFNTESQERFISDTSRTRKLLEICKEDFFLAADKKTGQILGIIYADEDEECGNKIQEYSKIVFYGNARWKLVIHNETVFCYEWGNYYATKRERMNVMEEKLPEHLRHSFFEKLFYTLEQTSHGAIVIVAKDAEAEAQRLGKVNRAICVSPFNIRQQEFKLLSRMSDVDGAVIIDFNGICYAFGVILDGQARAMGEEKRGARYNSSITYIAGKERIAFIASEDKEKGVEVFYGKNIELIDKDNQDGAI